MKITVNGVQVPVKGSLDIRVEVDADGEVLPPTTIVATGGKLDVYRSRVSLVGNVSVHLFSEEKK